MSYILPGLHLENCPRGATGGIWILRGGRGGGGGMGGGFQRSVLTWRGYITHNN